MEKEFKLVLSNDLFDKVKHTHYHYYKTILDNTRNINLTGIHIYPACNFDNVSKKMKAMGANLTEIKPQMEVNNEKEI